MRPCGPNRVLAGRRCTSGSTTHSAGQTARNAPSVSSTPSGDCTVEACCAAIPSGPSRAAAMPSRATFTNRNTKATVSATPATVRTTLSDIG